MDTTADYPRDAGTRSFLDSYRAILFGDKRNPSDDIDAVFSRGEGRTVSCFLRATFDPFPDAFAPGALRIDARTVSWSRGILGKGGKGAALPLVTPFESCQVRPPGGPGEKAINPHAFAVVEAACPAGTIALAVPTVSVELVQRRIQAT